MFTDKVNNLGDINEKDYLSIREAAEKLGYTRQYVYRALSNRFKKYLKIINGEKKLHIDVLKLVECNHVNQDSKHVDGYNVNMVTDKNFVKNNHVDEKINNEANCNHVNLQGEQLGYNNVNMVTDVVTNKTNDFYEKTVIDENSNQVNKICKHDVYSLETDEKEKFFNETISILKQQLLAKDVQLNAKDNQLQEKDKQIQNLQDELNLQNEHVRKQSDRLVDLVEQVNELQRNNQVLLAQKDIDNTKEITQSKEHKGMFDWLFKKNN